ncbi:MAG: Flp family type IVb pilin [Hyphomicrobiales bacterium]|jgi:pilus assembly protein Flp/PilA|nr:MAG: Flp family type IVb pilin [Hyphomicrobiales bacterium]
MRGVWCQIRRFVADDSGATAIEYGLIAGLVAIGALVAMTLTGDSVISMFDYVSGRTIEQLDNINDI